jgi:hypothetical protein
MTPRVGASVRVRVGRRTETYRGVLKNHVRGNLWDVAYFSPEGFRQIRAAWSRGPGPGNRHTFRLSLPDHLQRKAPRLSTQALREVVALARKPEANAATNENERGSHKKG